MSDIFYGLRSGQETCNDDSSTATDSFIDSFIGMIGGSEKKIPNGGYPPITICQNKKQLDSPKKSNKDLKKREFATQNDSGLSIHQILDDRKRKPIFDI
jgi:hypothetical protein